MWPHYCVWKLCQWVLWLAGHIAAVVFVGHVVYRGGDVMGAHTHMIGGQSKLSDTTRDMCYPP
jgi:hypothetical protein